MTTKSMLPCIGLDASLSLSVLISDIITTVITTTVAASAPVAEDLRKLSR